MSENSTTHAYTRLDFLNRPCTSGLAALAVNSIGIKVEGLEGNDSVSNEMSEHGKGREAKLNEIIQLIEIEKEALCSKITVLKKENQAASSKIDELEEENRAASSKIDELEEENQVLSSRITDLEEENQAASSRIAEVEEENQAASSKIAELEEENQAASSKIDELEEENQAALSKIDELEKEKQAASWKIKELRTMVEKFEKYKCAQLRKEKELRAKFQDFRRHTKAELEKEKEAAISKITMLENELEANEIRMYKQAIRALKQIQDEDKEPTKKVKELTASVEKLAGERNYWETLAKQLKAKESETAELVEARKEMIRVLSDLCNGNMDIGVKKFGVVDNYPFRAACKQKFSCQVAEEKAIELCSIWQTAVEDPKWDPFRTITSNGEVQGLIIDKEDKKLQQLREEWGDEVYLAVAVALTEIRKYTKGRTITHQLWNFMEGRKATLKEVLCLMEKKLKEANIKLKEANIKLEVAKIKDKAFVKVDQLAPAAEGMNLVVKVLNTNVVVDETESGWKKFPPPQRYSNRRSRRLVESLVGDETGSIIFTARSEQVDLMKPGSILLLKGAKVQMYRGSMRLAVDHHAQIITAEPVEFAVNEDNNVSLIEFELVDVPDGE